jgi:hypothetical protein
MNYSFRGAFNYGFKSSFGSSNFKFSKSFFNNKYNMSFSSGSSNQSNKFQVNFGNKNFMSKLQNLLMSQTLTSQISKSRIVSGLMGTVENESDSELGKACAEPTDVVVLLGDICLIRDDCKWTCGTRLASGPQSPVLAD